MNHKSSVPAENFMGNSLSLYIESTLRCICIQLKIDRPSNNDFVTFSTLVKKVELFSEGALTLFAPEPVRLARETSAEVGVARLIAPDVPPPKGWA